MYAFSRRYLGSALLVVSLSLGAAPPDTKLVAQGQQRFMDDCAACHGATGKGDGPTAGALRTRPADLTALASRNGGDFPAQYVATVIDGRSFQSLAHGDVEMPVWGSAYRRSLAAYSERKVAQNIAALTAYLRTIQAQ
jgi:mono/diheme cytochrome c family protein